MKKSGLSIIMAALAASACLGVAQDADKTPEPVPVPPPALPVPPTPSARPAAPVRESRRAERALADQIAELDKSKNQLAESAKALAKSQKDMALAQAGGDYVVAQKLTGVTSGGGASRSLVIPKDAGDAKGNDEAEYDLNVMAHILDKAVASDTKVPNAMGITVFGRSPFGGAPNLYIEGHGAIFFLNVNYPLLPPPSKEKERETKDKTSSEWEEARREMAHSGRSQSGDVFGLWEQRLDGPQWVGKGVEYDADKVNELKKDLLTAMKNAANIRRLKGDETITVVVTGGAGNAGKLTRTSGGGAAAPNAFVFKDGGKSGHDSAKLIIRARKSDAESFQNGKLDFDDFRKRATVMLY